MENKGIPILRKDYWKKICPDSQDPMIAGTTLDKYTDDEPIFLGVKQSEFLREYDPMGHKVNSKIFYPNIIKKDEQTGRFFEEEISRVAFSFQQIILIKQLSALCGNPTKFRLPITVQTDEHDRVFSEWKEGWAVKDMDILIHNAYKSIGLTGDTAVYMFLGTDGRLGHKVFSFKNGDILYPHYDKRGRLEILARRYTTVDEYGGDESRVDVFTSKHIITLREVKGANKTETKILNKYTIYGYEMVSEPKGHGLPFIPIAYYRDEGGAWWSKSQKTIEEFEWAFSCLTHSNMAYAFPIMYVKGSEVEIEPDMVRNTVKAIFMPNKDSEAGFLPKSDGSSSFELQLKKLYDMIFQQSFAVNPPEVRSGDLPGVAIKLLYSPSIEKAQEMANELNPFLDNLVDMFTYLYGMEKGKITEFTDLKVYAYQEPYVHQNDSEVISNLDTACSAGFLSKKSATEISPYSNNNEIDRIDEEIEAAYQLDNLVDLKATIDGNSQIDVIPKMGVKEESDGNEQR